jgi:tRNA-2-methylthio-N6-dimethylallyladenosine synthase
MAIDWVHENHKMKFPLFVLSIVGSFMVFQVSSAFSFSPSPLNSKLSLLRKATSESLESWNTLSDPVAANTGEEKQKKKKSWFPVKPEDALLTQYDTIVRGAYVRHVLLETEEMSDVAMKMYLKVDFASLEHKDKLDPFGKLAKDLSACIKSKDEAGKIGWVDNPFHSSHLESNSNVNDVLSDLISQSVIEEIFQARPKGGDILKIQDKSKQIWHLLRVDDLLIDYVPNSRTDERLEGQKDMHMLQFKQKGVNKVITTRSKLKGFGVTAIAPKIASVVDESEFTEQIQAKTYHIATSGCQMNVADSERLAGVLENKLSLSIAQNPAKADVVILNTCSIRDHAEQKVYDALGPFAARKRRGEPLALIVSGCVAQQEGEALLKRVPEIDLVMGPQYVSRLGDLLDDVSRGHQVVATDPTLLSEDLSRPVRGHDVRAWVNVINGCNEHCTYCVVPGVRGVEQSRSMESILNECMYLAEAGYKEVTLLGQNIDAYGRDLNPRRTFSDLLHYLNEGIPDGTIERIRYVTSHPRYFSDRVIDAVASLDKVCECFHMPFQSGDDEILKNMRRGYTFDSYMKIIDKIKERAPDASICGDVIVGFPGETDDQFKRTLELMERVKFDNLNTFAYSQRPNTEAALWDNQVPDDIKAERLQIVQRLAAQHGLERSQRYIGKVVEVLVEDRNPRNGDQVMGRTRQNRQVFFDGNIDVLKGKLVNVKIIEARTWSLLGEVV